MLAGLGAAAAAGAVLRRRCGGQVPRGLRLREAITIQAPAAKIYELWRDPATHAALRRAVVTPVGEEGTVWHWRRKLHRDGAIEGDVRIVEEKPPERLAWVTENLRVQFHSGLPAHHVAVSPRGELLLHALPAAEGELQATEVRLRFEVPTAPPLPWVRHRIRGGVHTALRRLRALAETGELATIAGQPAGTRTRRGRLLLRTLHARSHPAPARQAS